MARYSQLVKLLLLVILYNVSTIQARRSRYRARSYRPLHETLCKSKPSEAVASRDNVEHVIREAECHRLREKSHYCNVVFTPTVRKHTRLRFKFDNVPYRCEFSYVQGCERRCALVDACLRLQGKVMGYSFCG